MKDYELASCDWPEIPALPPIGEPVLLRVLTATNRSTARIQLRTAACEILAAWSGSESSSRLRETPRGPVWPSLIGGYSVSLSFSYGAGAGWIALVRGGAIGVDAMRAEPCDEIADVARLYLGPTAWPAIAASPDPALAFARAWTKFEALLKYTGRHLVEWRERESTVTSVLCENLSNQSAWPVLVAGNPRVPPVSIEDLGFYVLEHDLTVVTLVASTIEYAPDLLAPAGDSTSSF